MCKSGLVSGVAWQNLKARRTWSDVTQILSAIEQGDPHATDKLLPATSEFRQFDVPGAWFTSVSAINRRGHFGGSTETIWSSEKFKLDHCLDCFERNNGFDPVTMPLTVHLEFDLVPYFPV